MCICNYEMELYTVKLEYNKHGYNEFMVITTKAVTFTKFCKRLNEAL
jgi:hypothetical protein